MESQSTVFVVDDDSAFLESLCALVASMGLHPRGYATGEAFLAEVDEQTPGCLILDLKMPGVGGIELLAQLSQRRLVPPVVILSGHADVRAAVSAIQLGVVAFLEKHSYCETALWEAVQLGLVRDGEQRAAHHRRAELLARLATLTDSERTVLDLLLQGKDHSQIAAVLSKSRRTVENRRSRIMQKLGVSTFPQLIRLSIEVGLTNPSAAKNPGG